MIDTLIILIGCFVAVQGARGVWSALRQRELQYGRQVVRQREHALFYYCVLTVWVVITVMTAGAVVVIAFSQS